MMRPQLSASVPQQLTLSRRPEVQQQGARTRTGGAVCNHRFTVQTKQPVQHTADQNIEVVWTSPEYKHSHAAIEDTIDTRSFNRDDSAVVPEPSCHRNTRAFGRVTCEGAHHLQVLVVPRSQGLVYPR
jgi:hypothetical protein